MLRHTVQFHWTNEDWADFNAFLASMAHEKRKKIRQERRKVAEAGRELPLVGAAHDIAPADWDFFYRCYERTYHEHGNAPYLTRDFFRRMARTCRRTGCCSLPSAAARPIASSLIALGEQSGEKVAYGRYWGALERVDCLHFEACYYQPLQWCIAHGWHRFEGGAQGEHKMARALMPVRPPAHIGWRIPAFADAVERFLRARGPGYRELPGTPRGAQPFPPRRALRTPPPCFPSATHQAAS